MNSGNDFVRSPDIEADKVERVWSLIEDRDDNFRYEINRDHPLVVALSELLDGSGQTVFSHLLRVVESTFPVEDAYSRLGSENSHAPATVESAELIELARAFYAASGAGVEALAQRLALVEPFSSINNLESFLREAVGA